MEIFSNKIIITVSIRQQFLRVCQNRREVARYPVSTSKYGIGNRAGSNKTPLGRHVICSKVGRNAGLGTVFVRRRKTGKVVRIIKSGAVAGRDWITTRILRLKGLDLGVNSGEGIDSFKRCIYIHGTPDEGRIGKPASHGCIRMKNKDIVELFGLVTRGTTVEIRR